MRVVKLQCALLVATLCSAALALDRPALDRPAVDRPAIDRQSDTQTPATAPASDAQTKPSPAPISAPTGGASPRSDKRDGAKTAADPRRKQVGLAGIAVLFGMLLLGLALLMFTVVWGRRIRRLARTPTTTVPLDPLWYLRGSTPDSQTGSQTDSRTGSQTPGSSQNRADGDDTSPDETTSP